jgi:hypothetical protein
MTRHIVQLATNAGIAFVLALLMMPVLEVAAQRPTSRECQTRISAYIRDNALRVNDAMRARALRYCVAGDMDRALAVLRGAAPRPPQTSKTGGPDRECLRELEAYIRKNNLQPSPTVRAQARRRCATGDVKAAIEIVRSRPPSPPEDDARTREANCAKRLDAYIARNNLQVDAQTRRSAVLQCASGNVERALEVLKTPPPPRPSAPEAAAADRCLRDLIVFIKRAGLRPDERTYATATARCKETGDVRSAIEVLRAGTQLPPRPVPPLTEPECLERLDLFIRRTGVNPDEETYAKSRAHCATGDLRNAINTIRSGG